MPILSYRMLAAVSLLLAAIPVRACEPVDIYGDALPPGAVARLGSNRLRHAAGAIAFTPDGKSFATGGSDFMIRLWNAADGREIRVFKGHTAPVQAVAFSVDGSRLYSGSQDGTLREWNVFDGREVRSVNVAKVVFTGMVAHPTAPRLLSSDLTGIREWDLKEGKESRNVALANAGIPVALNPDGKTFALFKDNAVSLRDLDDKEVRSFPVVGANLKVLKLAFSADGSTLGAICFDQAAIFWDVKTGRQINRLPGSFFVLGAFTLSAKGNYFAVKTGAGAVRMAGVSSGEELRQFHMPNENGGVLAIAPDGKHLVLCQSRNILLWDLEAGRPVGGGYANHTNPISAVRFSPDGKSLTSVSDGRVTWWDPTTSKPVAAWIGQPLPFPLVGPDGRTFFTATPLGLSRFDLTNGQPVEKRLVTSPNNPFHCLAVSPDQKIVVVSGVDRMIIFRSTEDGRDLGRLPMQMNPVPAPFAIAPDGKRLATMDNGAIRIWRVPSAETLLQVDLIRKNPDPNGTMVPGLVFSPDGMGLLTVGQHGVVLWESASGRHRWIALQSASKLSGSIAYSLDGRLAAVASAAGSIHILDTATGTHLAEMSGHRAAVRCLDFSPDGTRLASGSDDGTVLLWDMKDLNKKVRPALVNLTEEQLAVLWRDLADLDSAKAYKAMRALANSPQGISYVVAREEEELGRVRKLLVQLDDDDFEVRDKAQKELERLGPAIFPLLRLALRNQPQPEVKLRIELILGPSKEKEAPTDMLRTHRAMEALEFAGTADAIKALKAIAGNVNDPLVRDAKAALDRLERRGARP